MTTKKVARKVGYFSAALLLSSTAWNRYIAYYQDILEKNDVTPGQFARQNYVMKVSLSVAHENYYSHKFFLIPAVGVVLHRHLVLADRKCSCTFAFPFVGYFL